LINNIKMMISKCCYQTLLSKFMSATVGVHVILTQYKDKKIYICLFNWSLAGYFAFFAVDAQFGHFVSECIAVNAQKNSG
jgi:hypothetical protein